MRRVPSRCLHVANLSARSRCRLTCVSHRHVAMGLCCRVLPNPVCLFYFARQYRKLLRESKQRTTPSRHAEAEGRKHSKIERDFLKGSSMMIVTDFGAKADNTTDCSPAFEAAITAMSDPTITSRGTKLFVPKGDYRLSRPLSIRRGMTLEGEASGAGSNTSTTLYFDSGSTGIIFESYSSSLDGGVAAGATLRNLNIFAAGKSALAHGVILRSSGNIENVYVNAFMGDGVHIFASISGSGGEVFPAWQPNHAYKLNDSIIGASGGWYLCRKAGTSASAGTGPAGTPTQQVPIVDGTVNWQYVAYTNANLFRLYNVTVANCSGDGFHTSGGDANVGTAIGCDATQNGGWGINDNSFLGNTWIGCHTSQNGAGPFTCVQANARSVFLGCYSESNQTPSLINSPSQVYGGLHAAGVNGTATCIVNSSLQGQLISSQGTTGPYNATATTNGTTSVVLSALSTPLEVGDVISIAGLPGRIVAISGLTLTMDKVFPTGSAQAVVRPNKMALILGDLQVDSLMQFKYWHDGGSFDLKYLPPGTLTVDGATDLFLWRLANTGICWGWGHTEVSALGANADNPARQLPTGTLFTGTLRGIVNEGVRIIHSNDPTTRSETNFQMGDIIFRRDSSNPSADYSAGWKCVSSGCNGAYAEGRTATTNGTTKVVLNAATGVLRIGDVIKIAAGAPAQIRDISADRKTLTMDIVLPAGAAQAIAYVAPVFTPFGQMYGGHGDSTVAPVGDATLNTWKGRSCFAAGHNTCTITNNKVTVGSIVTAVLQSVDATLTSILVVQCFAGSFVVRANAACTANTNFGWVVET